MVDRAEAVSDPAATKPSRRTFLKWSGVAGVGAGLVACSAPAEYPADQKAARSTAGMLDADKTVWSACMVNCGARCPLRLQVKDGQVVRVLPDNTGVEKLDGTPWRIPACPRGRSIRQRIYNPDRLKTPLKRKPGTKRGEGQWEKISWEQAFDEIAKKYDEILGKYGPESSFIAYGTGVIGCSVSQSYSPSGGPLAKLLSLKGGFLTYYGDYSTGGITEAMRVCYGGYFDTNSTDDLVNTKLYVMWGHSPMETKMSGGSEAFYLPKFLRKAGVKVVAIDPRYSDSVQLLADEWLAPKPGTDAALAAGLAWVLLDEGLHDQAFLDKYCLGFDDAHLPEGVKPGSSYRDYIEGKGPDGTPKTPQWAEGITGVPAEKIINLARELGNNKPSMIVQGWAPQRQANGENSARAIITLNAMLGNVGLKGGGTGTFVGSSGIALDASSYNSVENPVTKKISHFSWMDAMERGPEMRGQDGVRDWDADGNPIEDPHLNVPIKSLWVYGSNVLINQHSEVNNSRRVLADDSLAELIVVCENQLTASAAYADYLLPGTMTTEEDDVVPQGLAANMGYLAVSSKATEPLYDSKPIYEICTELAKRWGIEDKFTEGKTQLEWARQIFEDSRKENPDIPGYDQMREQGVYKRMNPSAIGLEDFRKDRVANPLDTPSGLIEIYSPEVAHKAETWQLPEGDVVTAVPEFIHTWEDAEAAKNNEKYPLQMTGYHFKGRTHSSYGNVAWLKEAHNQVVWINPADANARGIENNDKVQVFNDRGCIELQAKVTPRIIRGVCSVPEGAWYKPDAERIDDNDFPIDRNGCANVLTRHHPSALAKSNPQYTNNVQIRKAK